MTTKITNSKTEILQQQRSSELDRAPKTPRERTDDNTTCVFNRNKPRRNAFYFTKREDVETFFKSKDVKPLNRTDRSSDLTTNSFSKEAREAAKAAKAEWKTPSQTQAPVPKSENAAETSKGSPYGELPDPSKPVPMRERRGILTREDTFSARGDGLPDPSPSMDIKVWNDEKTKNTPHSNYDGTPTFEPAKAETTPHSNYDEIPITPEPSTDSPHETASKTNIVMMSPNDSRNSVVKGLKPGQRAPRGATVENFSPNRQPLSRESKNTNIRSLFLSKAAPKTDAPSQTASQINQTPASKKKQVRFATTAKSAATEPATYKKPSLTDAQLKVRLKGNAEAQKKAEAKAKKAEAKAKKAEAKAQQEAKTDKNPVPGKKSPKGGGLKWAESGQDSSFAKPLQLKTE